MSWADGNWVKWLGWLAVLALAVHIFVSVRGG